jgi:hypothetical protein
MTSNFDIVVDERIKCRGTVEVDSFTVTNASDPAMTMSAPTHQLFAFLQEALQIPTGNHKAATSTVSGSSRQALIWSTADGRRHRADIEIRDGELFSVRQRDGIDIRAVIHPREFWAAACSVFPTS